MSKKIESESTKVIKKFVELSSNRKIISGLKRIAVEAQEYELACDLRAIELKHFPEANTATEEYQSADRFIRVLKAFDLNVNIRAGFIIYNVVLMLEENKESFDFDKTKELIEKAKKIFGE